MKVQWFNHLPKDKQEDFKNHLKNSTKVLDRLKEICYNVIQNGEKVSVQDYENPSWAYKQADMNGYLRAYREIADLCNLSKDQ